MKWLIHTTTIINTIGDCVVAIHINSDTLQAPWNMPHTLFPVMHSPMPILQLVICCKEKLAVTYYFISANNIICW